EDVADGDVVGIATQTRRLVLDRPVCLLARLGVARGGEDHLAPAAGEALAATTGAGLDNDRMALRRPRHGEGPARGEISSFVIEPLHLGRVGVAAALLVDEDRA